MCYDDLVEKNKGCDRDHTGVVLMYQIKYLLKYF